MTSIVKFLKWAWEWFQIIAVSILLAVLINLFVLQPIRVEGRSMMPTLHNNDFLIISRIGKTLNTGYDYDDIVVIDKRTDRKRTFLDDIKEISFFRRLPNKNLWIKRIIGKEGDVIEIKNGEVYRNGEKLNETYIKDEKMDWPDETYKVPKGHVFVMGDNRNDSMDSRVIGYIPIENIKGKMAFDVSSMFR